MVKNINKKEFDEATKLKLKIFGESFEEWLPVFIHDKYTTEVYIFDFFAGSGTDIKNNLGSPLILLDKAKGNNRKYCANAKKPVKFFFNEGKTRKSNKLKKNIDVFIEQCKKDNNCLNCVYEYHILNYDFKELFSKPDLKRVFKNKKIAKFVLLDQYGFSQINQGIFKQLISFPKTDFIFFISSSFINRFKDHPNTKQYIDTSKIAFDDIEPKEIHRAVADYFRNLIPDDKEYYLHHFSIKKGANYYGLIFGSNHTLGMEKFLKVCWKYDPLSGEASFKIEINDFEEGTLFYNPETTVIKEKIKNEIKELILSGKISDNKAGLKHALKRGCEPKLFTEVVQELINNKSIKIVGKFNKQSTKIHRITELYKIKKDIVMVSKHKIEWTEQTWNPTAGCTKVSAGCKNCYAETMAIRLQAMGIRGYENGFQFSIVPERLYEPLKRKKPTIFFVNSMSDLFHENNPEEYLNKIFEVIKKTPHHTYQILTKRAGKMFAYFFDKKIPENVWLGVTVENKKEGLPRIDYLRQLKASVLFLSIEPLLEDLGKINLTNINWVIVGGESGVKARPMDKEWVLNIKKQCDENNIAFFFKQWGTWGADKVKRNKKLNGKELNGKVWQEYPNIIKENFVII